MKNIFNILILMIVALTSTTYAAENVEHSWRKAVVYIPHKFFATDLDGIKIDVPMPVLLLMHGCTGITNEELNWARFIKNMGFIVILPDSFARPGRLSNCDPKMARNSGKFPKADIYRQEEIQFALSKILASSWADRGNIFLMGHSEGGRATALYPNSEFAGEIISGNTCTDSISPERDGLRAPKNIPVLAMASIDDVWRKGKPGEGKCSDKAEGRSAFRQLNLDGWQHETYLRSEAREAVKEFLTQHLAK